MRRAGRSPTRRQGGAEDPPAKIFGVYDPKSCIFKALSPVFYETNEYAAGWFRGGGGVGRPPSENF